VQTIAYIKLPMAEAYGILAIDSFSSSVLGHYKKNVILRHLHCDNLAITVAICLFYEFSNGLCDTLVNRRNIMAILKRQFIFLQRPLKSLAPIFIL
jgi:hypothetical protein